MYFFFSWIASQNMVSYQENPQACFNSNGEESWLENWGNYELNIPGLAIEKNSWKIFNVKLWIICIASDNKQLNLTLNTLHNFSQNFQMF